MPFPTSSFAQSGTYTNIQEIAQSADAVIYQAQDAARRRTVAVKAMAPGGVDPQRVQLKLMKEGRILKGINHDHIIAFYDLLIDPQSSERYLVCEYSDAGSLGARLLAKKQLPEREAIAITLQLCAALEALAQQQIIHRDLKPSNILLFQGAQGGLVAKLSDFGVADDHASQTGTMRAGMHYPGTPNYMAPEQRDITRALDVRTDLYALGLVLGEMLAGKPYKPILQGNEQLRAYAPQASAGISAVVAKATQAEISLRYQSPAELAEDLRRVSAGQQPKYARPRRRALPVPVLLGSAVLVVFVLAWALIRLLGQGQEPVAEGSTIPQLSAADATGTALAIELQQAANQATIQALEMTQAAEQANADATATANALIQSQADADATATAEAERLRQAQADADATATAEALAAELNARQQAVRNARTAVEEASNEATLAADQARQTSTTESAATARAAANNVRAAVEELMTMFKALEQLGPDAVPFDLKLVPTEAGQAITVADRADEAASSAESRAQMSPQIFLRGTEEYELRGSQFTRYRLGVSNWSIYSSDLFLPGPVACGTNTNASRTWVSIYNAVTDDKIYGFCAFNEPQNLDLIWFAVPLGTSPPEAVYVLLEDKATDNTYRSNVLPIR